MATTERARRLKLTEPETAKRMQPSDTPKQITKAVPDYLRDWLKEHPMSEVVIIPESNQDYAAKKYSEMYQNGTLDAALKNVAPSAKDLEAAKNCKPGVPEISREDAKRKNPKASPIPERTIMSIAASRAPHVTISDAKRREILATKKRLCCGCRRRVDPSEMKPVRDPDMPGYIDRCEKCRAEAKHLQTTRLASLESRSAISTPIVDDYTYPEIQRFLADTIKPEHLMPLFAWRRGNRSIPEYILEPFSLLPFLYLRDGWEALTPVQEPEPPTEPDSEPEKWQTVMLAIGTPIKVESMDYVVGLSPKFEYDTSYDVPLPPVNEVERQRFKNDMKRAYSRWQRRAQAAA